MRMKWYRAFAFLFTSIATGLAAAFIVLLLRPDLAGNVEPESSQPVLLERSGGPVSYAVAVQRAAPAALPPLPQASTLCPSARHRTTRCVAWVICGSRAVSDWIASRLAMSVS